MSYDRKKAPASIIHRGKMCRRQALLDLASHQRPWPQAVLPLRLRALLRPQNPKSDLDLDAVSVDK